VRTITWQAFSSFGETSLKFDLVFHAFMGIRETKWPEYLTKILVSTQLAAQVYQEEVVYLVPVYLVVVVCWVPVYLVVVYLVRVCLYQEWALEALM
jgi:hypothetical protein